MQHFEETFGKPVRDMDEGEWRIAVFSLIHGLRMDNEIAHRGINVRLDETNGKVKKIPEHSECLLKHSLYFKLMACLGTPIMIAILVAVVKLAFGI